MTDTPDYPDRPCGNCGSEEWWLPGQENYLGKPSWICSVCHPEPKDKE